MEELEEDHIDINELEANLYAKIHHDAPEMVIQFTTDEIQKQQKLINVQPSRVVTNKTVVNNTSTGPKSNQPIKGGRYWIGGNKSGGPQPHKSTNSNTTTKNRVNPFSIPNKKETISSNQSIISTPIITADYRPKPFTPYTSLLSHVTEVKNSEQIHSVQNPDLPGQNAAAETTVTKVKQLKVNRKKEKHRPNPFNRLNEAKMKKVQKLDMKRKHANNAKVSLKAKSEQQQIINLDSSAEDSDNDDVICIPVTPPPLVCIESSGDEDENISEPEDDSPSDDFIGQRDRSRISQSSDGALGELCDDELDLICATVDGAIKDASRQSNNISTTEEIGNVPDQNVDNVVFVTPTKNLPTNANKAYEVPENSFAAVDVYESESSDFPESIYEKGKRTQRKNVTGIDAVFGAAAAAAVDTSDSDDEIQINTQNRSKRMRKRKSSGSNKGSDYLTCTDDDEMISPLHNDSDGEAYVDILKNTSTPHIKRGEAINNAKMDMSKLKTATKRKKINKISEPQSDDEFLSMLSCIVHDSKDNDDEVTPTQNESIESIEARDIVEHVLNKAGKSNTSTPTNVIMDGKSKQNWVVTDEVRQENDDVSNSNNNQDVTNLKITDEGKCNEWVVIDQVGKTDLFENNIDEFLNENNKDKSQSVVIAQQQSTSKNDSTSSVNRSAELVSVEKSKPSKNEDKRDNISVRGCSLVVDPEIGWNDEMKCFYNKSWGGENHSLKLIQRTMPSKYHFSI